MTFMSSFGKLSNHDSRVDSRLAVNSNLSRAVESQWECYFSVAAM